MPPHLRSQITVKCGLLHPCRGNMKIMLPLYTIARFLPLGSDGILIMLVLLRNSAILPYVSPSTRAFSHALRNAPRGSSRSTKRMKSE
jgi:hypothetical protein